MRDRTFLSQIKLPTIKELRGLAYKKVFTGLTYQEEVILDKGLSFYPKTNLSVRDIDKLISINQILIRNERGEFKEAKEKVKEFNLNYRAIYGVF